MTCSKFLYTCASETPLFFAVPILQLPQRSCSFRLVLFHHLVRISFIAQAICTPVLEYTQTHSPWPEFRGVYTPEGPTCLASGFKRCLGERQPCLCGSPFITSPSLSWVWVCQSRDSPWAMAWSPLPEQKFSLNPGLLNRNIVYWSSLYPESIAAKKITSWSKHW